VRRGARAASRSSFTSSALRADEMTSIETCLGARRLQDFNAAAGIGPRRPPRAFMLPASAASVSVPPFLVPRRGFLTTRPSSVAAALGVGLPRASQVPGAIGGRGTPQEAS
jgi:hypothetical protein